MMIFRISQLIHWAFLAYTVILFIRVVGSWFPNFAYHPFMRWVYRMTEPYLGMFRRVIPPIGGVLDLSPLLGFFVLQIAEAVIFMIFKFIAFRLS